MRYITFALLFKYEQGLIVVLNTRSSIYRICKSPFTPTCVKNKLQAEGKVIHICTVERREKQDSTLFSNKNNEAQLLVYLK